MIICFQATEKFDMEKFEAGDSGVDLSALDRAAMRDAVSSDSSDDENMQHNAVDLAKPEFEGLWDHHKPYNVPKDIDSSPLKLPGASKMDKV
jgi:hypothetical protein